MKTKQQVSDTAICQTAERSATDSDSLELAANDRATAAPGSIVGQKVRNIIYPFINKHSVSHKTIILPDPISYDDVLAEQDLEQVAGGGSEAVKITNCCTSVDGSGE